MLWATGCRGCPMRLQEQAGRHCSGERRGHRPSSTVLRPRLRCDAIAPSHWGPPQGEHALSLNHPTLPRSTTLLAATPSTACTTCGCRTSPHTTAFGIQIGDPLGVGVHRAAANAPELTTMGPVHTCCLGSFAGGQAIREFGSRERARKASVVGTGTIRGHGTVGGVCHDGTCS